MGCLRLEPTEEKSTVLRCIWRRGNSTKSGVDRYDYGARFYDPQIGRWHVIDAMYDKHYDYTPYAYVINNPMLNIDPNGLTDYKFNKETGEVTQVGDVNDKPDRILKTKEYGKNKGEIKYKKNGEAKVAIGDIEKGILSDGMNFKTDDNIIQVGGEGQPTLKGVQDFLVGFSDYIYTEMSGAYLQAEGESEPNAVYIDEYRGNDEYNAYTSIYQPYIGDLKYLHTSFHTHITSFNLNDKYPSKADMAFKKNNSQYFKRFIILSDLPEGQAYKY